MNEDQRAIAEQMAREGKTIARISKELGVSWGEVSAHVRSVHALSWQGAKMSITNRLNRLKRERNRSTREQLVDEAAKCVDYLYYEGKNLSKKVDRARNALGG